MWDCERFSPALFHHSLFAAQLRTAVCTSLIIFSVLNPAEMLSSSSSHPKWKSTAYVRHLWVFGFVGIDSRYIITVNASASYSNFWWFFEQNKHRFRSFEFEIRNKFVWAPISNWSDPSIAKINRCRSPSAMNDDGNESIFVFVWISICIDLLEAPEYHLDARMIDRTVSVDDLTFLALRMQNEIEWHFRNASGSYRPYIDLFAPMRLRADSHDRFPPTRSRRLGTDTLNIRHRTIFCTQRE